MSRVAAELDEQLSAWRNRPIGEITYLILDARYEKVRHDGAIVPCALLTAIGVGPDGKRSILGCSVQFSEAETHWRPFLQSLVDRGMRGVKVVCSDDHAGLKAARQAVLAGVPWQRRQFHLMQNAMAHVPKIAIYRRGVALPLARSRDTEVRADCLHEVVGNLTVTRDSGPLIEGWIAPPRMVSAFANQLATIIGGQNHAASRLERHFFKLLASGLARIFTIHLDGLSQGFSQVREKFFASLALRIHTRHFLDPTDLPPSVAPNDGRVRSRGH